MLGNRCSTRARWSVWVYGLPRGINGARELSEWCEWEPGLQWLLAVLLKQGSVSLGAVGGGWNPRARELQSRQPAAGGRADRVAAAHVAQVERAPEGEIGRRQEAARRGGSRAGRSG
jgi:hypothetical protein